MPTCRRKNSRSSSAGSSATALPAATSRSRTRRRRSAWSTGASAPRDAIGAVNTVWYEGDTLIGGNTDWYGIVASLDDMHPGWDADGRHDALVLGAGGSARASVFAFLERGLSVAIVNRTRERAEELAARFGAARARCMAWIEVPDLLRGADLLINNTSLGMAGKPPLEIDLSPLKRSGDRLRCRLCAARNRAAESRESAGHRTVDGLSMLLYQAVNGFSHWFGVTPAGDTGTAQDPGRRHRAKTG